MVGRILIAAASALATIAVVELSLRVVAPTAACDESMITITSFSQTTPGLQTIVKYQRDAHGLRREPPPRDPDFRILCVGASPTPVPTATRILSERSQP